MKNSLITVCFGFICLTYDAQVINTIAGTGVSGYTGDGGPATAATFCDPRGMAFDSAGNLYVADFCDQVIRKIDPLSGKISTVVGNGFGAGGSIGGFSGDGSPATSAELSGPISIAIGKSGNMYIADYQNYRIRKVSASSGIITTIAGDGTSSNSGDGGLAINAAIGNPKALALDQYENLYFCDEANSRVRMIDQITGIISTVAGSGSVAGYSGDGGLATAATLYFPAGIVIDSIGNIIVADTRNNCVRKITKSTGIITTIAGRNHWGFTGDGGPATLADMYFPTDLRIDRNGNLFIVDSQNDRVRKVIFNGTISTIAGDGNGTASGDGGPPLSAGMFPANIIIDAGYSMYISDNWNYRVRKMDLPDLVQERSDNYEIIAYPNPNKGQFYIASNSSKIKSLTIYNEFGEVVETITSNIQLLDPQIKINLTSPGLYFLSMLCENKIYRKKIIVQ
jgi:sugar lactone lactonase YvrE